MKALQRLRNFNFSNEGLRLVAICWTVWMLVCAVIITTADVTPE